MKHFRSINDVDHFNTLLQTAHQVKQTPEAWRQLGSGKSICLLFMNPSLRTRLSSQSAAALLGMEAVVLDINAAGWKLEFEDGAIMNGDSAEHIKEAAGVLGAYFDVIGVRSFAKLENKAEDDAEAMLHALVTHSGIPVINLESATAHPLQAFADVLTVQSFQKIERPKVVLSWAPHPKALPQAVANSFIRWMKQASVELVIAHPEGYELDANIVGSYQPEYHQQKALENADFVYAKNWSSVTSYGQILPVEADWMITAEKMKRTREAKFMHCLPVRRNVVVEDAILDSADSLVIEQAKHRITTMQTVLMHLLEAI